VARSRWQQLAIVCLALTFSAVLCAGAAQTLDLFLAKQAGELAGETGISDLSLLTPLHAPKQAISISSPQALWLLVPSALDLPPEPTAAQNYVRPPPFTA
jgi:hypothetical protein